MADRLEHILSNATEAEQTALTERFDPENHMDAHVRSRIAVRLNQKIKEERKRERREVRFPWKKALAAIAACVAVYLTLGMTVPGVADALYRLTHPDYNTEDYFSQSPDSREPVAEIDAAVKEIGATDVESTVELLGEYSIRTQWDEGYNEMAFETPSRRLAYGAEPYRAEDYAYLKEIKPSVREVYYDGTRLFVNVFLACPGADAFFWWEHEDETFPHRLDIHTVTQTMRIDGKEYDCSIASSGGSEMPDTQDGAYGLWYSSSYGLDAPLPDGICEMTLFYYIYDADIDDMGAIGNVARVIHTISFDTTPGNRHENNGFEVTFKGSAPMTVSTYHKTGEHATLQNRTVCFDGLKMRFAVAYLPSGPMVEAELLEYPASWTEQEKDALNDGFITAMCFDVVAGDETVTVPYDRISRRDGGWQFELPVLPSEYEGLKTVTIIPNIRYLTGFTGVADADPDDPNRGAVEHDVTLIIDGDPVPVPDHFRKGGREERTPLSDTRIEIPLPKDE